MKLIDKLEYTENFDDTYDYAENSSEVEIERGSSEEDDILNSQGNWIRTPIHL